MAYGAIPVGQVVIVMANNEDCDDMEVVGSWDKGF